MGGGLGGLEPGQDLGDILETTVPHSSVQTAPALTSLCDGGNVCVWGGVLLAVVPQPTPLLGRTSE